jgi:outer membrane protein OmpA-like peptidoglycan-associated protein
MLARMASDEHPTRLPLRLTLAALLLATALPRAAASDGALELFHGPDDAEGLALRTLDVRLDGQPLPVTLPAKGHDPSRVLLHQALPTGAHRLDVVVVLEAEAGFFSYVKGHRFTMRGVLQLDVLPGDLLDVRTRVVAVPGVTVKWENRHRLSLEATVRRSLQPQVAAVHDEPAPAARPAELAPEPAAVAAPAKPARSATACALAPIRFALDEATLSADAEEALDRFAECLVASGRAVRLEGHCDSSGSSDHNEWLGARRAAAAARHLRQRGVAPERITVRSMSASSPTCTGRGEDCRARNRRVEAVVLP